MKKSMVVAPIGVLAAMVGIGLVSLQNSASADDAAKREEQLPELVLIDDDDTDDTDDRISGPQTRSQVTNGVTDVSRTGVTDDSASPVRPADPPAALADDTDTTFSRDGVSNTDDSVSRSGVSNSNTDISGTDISSPSHTDISNTSHG